MKIIIINVTLTANKANTFYVSVNMSTSNMELLYYYILEIPKSSITWIILKNKYAEQYKPLQDTQLIHD